MTLFLLLCMHRVFAWLICIILRIYYIVDPQGQEDRDPSCEDRDPFRVSSKISDINQNQSDLQKDGEQRKDQPFHAVLPAG